jgi:hypothetical protein
MTLKRLAQENNNRTAQNTAGIEAMLMESF